LILNFFDENRFLPRMAIVLGNAFDENALTPIRGACQQCGIELHVRGLAAGCTESKQGAFVRN
jgi:hypothetical protein